MKTVIIALPIPERTLHPNARVHWARKARAVRQARYVAGWYARDTMTGKRMPRWDQAHIEVTPYYRDKRRRDADGLLASLKSSIDGIVDSGILADDGRLTYTLHPAQVDKHQPRVVLEIEEVTT